MPVFRFIGVIYPHMYTHMYAHVIRTVAAHLMKLVVRKVKFGCLLMPFFKIPYCTHVESSVTRVYICLCVNYSVVFFLL